MEDKTFNAAKRVLCCIHKQDIPEVEAVIRLLLPGIEAYWSQLVREMTQEALARLDLLDDNLSTPSVDALARAPAQERDRLLEDLVLAILASLERRAAQPVSAATSALLRSGVASLLADGARSTQSALDLSRAPLLPQAAQDDLLTLLRGRLVLHRDALRGLLEAFLTTRGPRTPGQTGLEAAARRAAGGAALSRQAWVAALAAELGQDTRSWLPFTLDQWAYRWFNIGGFVAARQDGAIAFQASAVRDNRTSPFCRWVDGRIVSVERIERQIRRHVEASLAGDIQALMDNWPLLSFRADDGPAEFALKFRSVGLPPYHGRCRTRVILVRLS